MKNIAIVIDNGPSDGGTFQYNQAFVDAFMELPDSLFRKTIFYTNSYWKEYLKKCPYKLKEIKLTIRLKRILKLITVLNLPALFRKVALYILSPSVAKSLNDIEIDLLLFPSQDTVSLFITSPKINVIHDLMHHFEPHFPEVSSNGRIRYRDLLFKNFCIESKAIIVDSKLGINQVIECYNTKKDKIYDLPYIPPPHILNNDPLPPDFEEKYAKLPENFLFYPGQFWPHKNHKNLLLAISSLINQGIEINMVFAGKMDYDYFALINLIEDLKIQKYITFLDFVPNEYLKGIYLKSKGLVMPTFFGPTNIPPLEAIFLERPVAVSDVYGMKDQLQDASLYFNPNDIADIAEKIKILLLDMEKRKQLIDNGKKLILIWNKNTFNRKFAEIINCSI